MPGNLLRPASARPARTGGGGGLGPEGGNSSNLTPRARRTITILHTDLPPRVCRFYQCDLPSPRTRLDLFLSCDRRGGVAKDFKVDESVGVVPLGKPVDQLCLVFIDPSLQVVRHAAVKHTH